MQGHQRANHCTWVPPAPLPWEDEWAAWFLHTLTWAFPGETMRVSCFFRKTEEYTCTGIKSSILLWLCYLWEVNVTVGHMLRLVVVVRRVCDACVILLHWLVLREGRLLCLQLRVHHMAAHQGLGPTRHGLCNSKHNRL